MEYASFLAGERWSDHPRCTHPLLAGLARDINDHISDTGRARLVALIPSVVGLNDDDPRIDVAIAARCAAMAVPVAAEFRQRALAAGLLVARRVFTDLDQESTSPLEASGLWEDMDRALASAPQALSWAERFVAETKVSPETFERRSAPNIVHVAVVGIAEACISDSDGLLHDLLETVIRDCTSRLGSGPRQRRSDRPSEILMVALEH